jgi:hypothetical protein
VLLASWLVTVAAVGVLAATNAGEPVVALVLGGVGALLALLLTSRLWNGPAMRRVPLPANVLLTDDLGQESAVSTAYRLHAALRKADITDRPGSAREREENAEELRLVLLEFLEAEHGRMSVALRDLERARSEAEQSIAELKGRIAATEKNDPASRRGAERRGSRSRRR